MAFEVVKEGTAGVQNGGTAPSAVQGVDLASEAPEVAGSGTAGAVGGIADAFPERRTEVFHFRHSSGLATADTAVLATLQLGMGAATGGRHDAVDQADAVRFEVSVPEGKG